MAIFRSGPIVGTISGNLQGVCFKNAKGSPVIAKRIQRTNQKTDAQLAVRNFMPEIRDAWFNLSTDDRRAWRNYARQVLETNRLGAKIHLSAWMHFFRWQLFLRTAGLPGPVFLPRFVRLIPPAGLVLDFSNSGSYQVTIDQWSGPTVPFNVVHSNRPVRSTPVRHQKYFRFIDTHQQGGNSWDIKAEWQAVFGVPQVGEQVRVRVRNVHSENLRSGTIEKQVKIKA